MTIQKPISANPLMANKSRVIIIIRKPSAPVPGNQPSPPSPPRTRYHFEARRYVPGMMGGYPRISQHFAPSRIASIQDYLMTRLFIINLLTLCGKICISASEASNFVEGTVCHCRASRWP
jgi:hypothetical protein